MRAYYPLALLAALTVSACDVSSVLDNTDKQADRAKVLSTFISDGLESTLTSVMGATLGSLDRAMAEVAPAPAYSTMASVSTTIDHTESLGDSGELTLKGTIVTDVTDAGYEQTLDLQVSWSDLTAQTDGGMVESDGAHTLLGELSLAMDASAPTGELTLAGSITIAGESFDYSLTLAFDGTDMTVTGTVGGTTVNLTITQEQLDAQRGCTDLDGDGYGDNCDAGPDCNDQDAELTDTCESPMCADADGDGYGEMCLAGPDCDDEDPNTYEGCPYGDITNIGYGSACADDDFMGSPNYYCIHYYGTGYDSENDCNGTYGLRCTEQDVIGGCKIYNDIAGDERVIYYYTGSDYTEQDCETLTVNLGGPGIWVPVTAPQCVDGDGDGYGANCEAGSDCNDDNAAVHNTCVSIPDPMLGNECAANVSASFYYCNHYTGSDYSSSCPANVTRCPSANVIAYCIWRPGQANEVTNYYYNGMSGGDKTVYQGQCTENGGTWVDLP